MIENVVAEAGDECSVVPFGLAMGMRVVSGGGHVCFVQSVRDDAEEFRDAYRAIVCEEVFQDAVRKDPVEQEGAGDHRSCCRWEGDCSENLQVSFCDFQDGRISGSKLGKRAE